VTVAVMMGQCSGESRLSFFVEASEEMIVSQKYVMVYWVFNRSY